MGIMYHAPRRARLLAATLVVVAALFAVSSGLPSADADDWMVDIGESMTIVRTAGGGAEVRYGQRPSPAPAPTDALQRRVRDELRVFTDWLEAHGAKGYIGEVGWPNDEDTGEWNALAEQWYADAAAADLIVTAWATGDWWGQDYKLSLYTASNWDWSGVDTPQSSAEVIERQAAPRRGVNVAGAEFGFPDVGATSPYSNASAGVYGKHWYYPTQATFDYLNARNVTTVRLPIRWERIQPRLGTPLDTDELQRLSSALTRAGNAGLEVILDVHNYGAYYLHDGNRGVRRPIGSAEVTADHFADLWRRLSGALHAHPALAGYGLMNEPVHMPGGARAWEAASQNALNAIRSNGDHTLVLVPGYEWSGVQRWQAVHPRPWITDEADRHRYEAHHYFDHDNSGRYLKSYAAEVTDAKTRGH